MKKVILGTVIVMAFITGCSEDKDPQPTCEQAIEQFNTAESAYWDAYLQFNDARTQYLTAVELAVYQKAEYDAHTAFTKALTTKKATCGLDCEEATLEFEIAFAAYTAASMEYNSKWATATPEQRSQLTVAQQKAVKEVQITGEIKEEACNGYISI